MASPRPVPSIEAAAGSIDRWNFSNIGGAGFDPGEIEQVGYQARKAVGLRVDGAHQPNFLLFRHGLLHKQQFDERLNIRS